MRKAKAIAIAQEKRTEALLAVGGFALLGATLLSLLLRLTIS